MRSRRQSIQPADSKRLSGSKSKNCEETKVAEEVVIPPIPNLPTFKTHDLAASHAQRLYSLRNSIRTVTANLNPEYAKVLQAMSEKKEADAEAAAQKSHTIQIHKPRGKLNKLSVHSDSNSDVRPRSTESSVSTLASRANLHVLRKRRKSHVPPDVPIEERSSLTKETRLRRFAFVKKTSEDIVIPFITTTESDIYQNNLAHKEHVIELIQKIHEKNVPVSDQTLMKALLRPEETLHIQDRRQKINPKYFNYNYSKTKTSNGEPEGPVEQRPAELAPEMPVMPAYPTVTIVTPEIAPVKKAHTARKHKAAKRKKGRIVSLVARPQSADDAEEGEEGEQRSKNAEGKTTTYWTATEVRYLKYIHQQRKKERREERRRTMSEPPKVYPKALGIIETSKIFEKQKSLKEIKEIIHEQQEYRKKREEDLVDFKSTKCRVTNQILRRAQLEPLPVAPRPNMAGEHMVSYNFAKYRPNML